MQILSDKTEHLRRATGRRGSVALDRTVLIAGTGRSGTTWLSKLLDASPQVLSKHEPDNTRLFSWFRDIPSRLDDVVDSDVHRDAFLHALTDAYWHHARSFAEAPVFSKTFLREPFWRALNLGMRTSDKLGVDPGPLPIPEWMFSGARDSATYVVKSVMSNLRLSWLHRQFPELRIVLIVRHPGGYINSWLTGSQRQFGERARLDKDVLPFVRDEQLRYGDAYENGSPLERELIYWTLANERPLIDLEGSDKLKVVVYEELCAEPRHVLSGLCEFIDIPFAPRMQAFIDASTKSHDERYYSIFKHPSVVANKWRDELSEEQLATVDRYLRSSKLAKLWNDA